MSGESPADDLSVLSVRAGRQHPSHESKVVAIQLDAQTFLNLVEKSGKLAIFDIEATGLKGDYNGVLCVSVKPYGKKPILFTVNKPGDDHAVVVAAKAALSEYDCWVSYYGKGFDVKMLNTRLLMHGEKPLPRTHHVDLYWHLREHTNTSRRSQAHLLRFFKLKEKKMDMDPDTWNRVLADPAKELRLMEKRCASDTAGLEALYRRTRHIIKEVSR